MALSQDAYTPAQPTFESINVESPQDPTLRLVTIQDLNVSLLHDPDVLILDEPTDGLDPNQKHEVRKLIKRLGEEKAILFSTHILEEVDAACSRAVIIDQGTIVADGTPEELRQQSGTDSLHDLFRNLTTKETE